MNEKIRGLTFALEAAAFELERARAEMERAEIRLTEQRQTLWNALHDDGLQQI